MKVLKFSLSLITTVLFIYILENSWELPGLGRIPPFGKFLDPFHGFWQNSESTNFSGEDEIMLAGLKDKVSIVYDSLLIPHIFAQNDEDLFFAQGYVTAQHRLWQMEFQTHAAAGRLSEIIGKALIDYDRGQRRFGMVMAAENSLRAMENDPIAKMNVDQYTAGINAYINQLDYKDLPLEYKLLAYEPEQWTPLKCGLLLKNMAQTLNKGDKDMQMTNALSLFGKEMVEILYPDNEGVADPIVEKPNGWNFNPVKMDSIPFALPTELINISNLEKPNPTIGSNNWAVSGSKTASGSPILCNDPHLNMSLPSIWYAIQLHAPGINTFGVSLPGAPNIIIGFTDSIAWGVTNGQRDLVDWFEITFKDEQKDQYKLDGEWRAIQKRVEKIVVRGGEDYYDTVLYTVHGPITYDETFQAENNRKNYAFRWMAHDESEELLTFYKLNRAKNHDDYMDALNHYASPAQNFVFASASGDIAMRIQGRFPVRRKLEGKFILDGSISSTQWQAYIPNEQNVMDKNPARGFVSSANQYPVDATYPYFVTSTSYEAYRNRRINEVLRADSSITVQDMMALQGDNLNLQAKESLPLMLTSLDPSTLTETEKIAFKILSDWDYFNTIESEGASYYEAWWTTLFRSIWDEMKNEEAVLSYPTDYTTIKLLAENPTFDFFDIKSTPEKETAKEVIQKAFKIAVEDVEKWKADKNAPPRWSDYKDTSIGHLSRQEPLGYHVETSGNSGSVNATSSRWGPSWRMIVEMKKSGPEAVAVYPGGQSGNPGSRFYNNLIDHWAKGKYYKMQFMHQPETTGTLYTTELNPKN